MRLPVVIAPVGALELFEPGAAASVARAAGSFGAAHMLSSVSEPGLEKTAEAAPDALRMSDSMSAAATPSSRMRQPRGRHGYSAFCLTVDTAHYSRRERDIAKRYVRASRVRATGGDFQKGLEWRTVKLIKDKFKIPLVIKGIATAEDAQIALDHGVDWIYCRTMAAASSTTAGAPCMCCRRWWTPRGGAKIMVDGGFCRGRDMVKAIAMAADMVGIGRLECFALAAGEAACRACRSRWKTK